MQNFTALKPWLGLYNGRSVTLSVERRDMLSIFANTVARSGALTAMQYFGSRVTYGTLDEQSGKLAAWFRVKAAVGQGSRIVIILQNVPEFAVAVLAAWKLGAVPVPLNPMYRSQELARLFIDCTPALIVCHRQQLEEILAGIEASARDAPKIILCPTEDPNKSFLLSSDHPTPYPMLSDSQPMTTVESVRLSPSDMGLLLYTSGTTGVPKGAVLSHGALAFNAHACRDWFGIRSPARILGIAPLFHITGFMCQMCSAFLEGGEMILHNRFDASAVLELMTQYRPTFMIGAITAYVALMNNPAATADHFKSFEALFSGGAPVPEAVLSAFKRRFGRRIATAYGMTETAAPTHVTPYELTPPVDSASGAVAIGIPISNVEAIIDDGKGGAAAVGELGQLLIHGPMVMTEYYNQPAATAEALSNGWMHTGDIAFMDDQGWFYLVDRLKDVIIASGFKVWPREVEDILYTHPAVREVAVVGIPDGYRGETVLACVSLRADQKVSADELLALCRSKLAAYKIPRHFEFLADLPKTATGKITRAALRKTYVAASGSPAKPQGV